MGGESRHLRRDQLDRQLGPLKVALPTAAPTHGWIRAVRESLGMSLLAFAKRLGVNSSTALQLERAEVNGSITLKRLRAAADVLGCDVNVVLVPRVPLSEMVEAQANEVASYRMQRLAHSMALEQQVVRETRIKEMTEWAAKDLIERGDKHLWD